MREEKKNLLPIEFIGTSHNSVTHKALDDIGSPNVNSEHSRK